MNTPAAVLIVDDSEQSRYVHARYLRMAGFEVIEAATGTEGLQRAPQADLVLLDVRLPDINGLEVCRRLKASETTASIPVLQTSASFVSVGDRVLGLQGGADAYLTVPIEPTELVATLKALLRLRRAETTARRCAEEWRTTFDAISDGICLLDGEHRIVRCNRALGALPASGLAAQPGPALAAWLGVDDPAAVQEFLGSPGDEPRDFPAGARWLRLRAHRVSGEFSPGRLVCVITDITRAREVETSLRRAEVKLAAHADTLEKRVEERTRELHSRNEELEAFTYSVSHDLRTPLRSMRNFASILIEDAGPRLDEESLDYLRRIEAAAERMDRLTGDLLRYSQLAQADTSLVDLDPETLLQQCIDALVAGNHAPREAFALATPAPGVRGNAAMLTQALQNLLGNAVKFTRPGRVPVIRCGATRVAPDRVRILVEDEGIGIEARYLERIFKPFEKLHSPSEFAGTGIGLAIVQRGVRRMGGQVGVESEVGRGSRFWIELPAA